MKKQVIICDRCNKDISREPSLKMLNGSLSLREGGYVLSFDHLTALLVNANNLEVMKEHESFDLCADCTSSFDQWFDASKSGN